MTLSMIIGVLLILSPLLYTKKMAHLSADYAWKTGKWTNKYDILYLTIVILSMFGGGLLITGAMQ